MKKTIRIHISGYIFNIEEDAYTILEEWLEKISSQYANEEGGDEIVNDIEMRVAELFQQEVGIEKGVISTGDAKKIIEIMGMPEEFEEEKQEQASFQKQETGQQKKTTTGKKPWINKRLYRDEENNILGGVCSGLGNYFEIDPIIIRIIFIVTIIFGGFGTIAYLVLWVIVPKAETTAQKLEMKGEAVNISNIEKVIKEEFENVKNRIIDQTKSVNFQNLKKKLDDVGDTLANVLGKLFKGVSGLVGFIFIVAGILAIIALFNLIFKNSLPNFMFFNSSIFEWKPFLGLLPIPVSTTFVSVLIFLLVVIPFLMLVLFGTKALFGYKSKGKFIGYTGLTLWIAGIVLASIVAIRVMDNYTTQNSHVSQSKIIDTSSNTLYLKLSSEYDKQFNEPAYTLGNYNIVNTKKSMKLYGKPNLNIEKSTSGETSLDIEYSANGKTKKDAFGKTKKMNYLWQQNDSSLTFNPYFTINGNNKLFKRELNMTLQIPEGKIVYIDSNMIDLIYDIENIENIWDHNMIGKKWIMTEKGLTEYILKKDTIEQETESGLNKTDTLNIKRDTIKVSNEISI